ncbi:MAG: hypothetical protein Q4E10_00950 [Porphyromonas sp.]|nr:hypothetical protein [Porphyromonas sp.]
MKLFSTWQLPVGIGDFALRADNVLSNSGKDFYRPDWMEGVEALPMLVVRIGKVAKCIEEQFADRYYDRLSLAFSLRASRIDDNLPEAMRENFDGSFVRWSQWVGYDDLVDRDRLSAVRMVTPQQLDTEVPLILPAKETISKALVLVSRYYLLKIGDLIALPAATVPISLEREQGLFMVGRDNEELIFLRIK